MRVAKFPRVANPTFIATPEDATFTLAFRDNTDGKYYAKRSDGIVEPLGGGGGAVTSETGVTATGTNQATAANITKDYVRVTVNPLVPGVGVKVLPAVVNARQRVVNDTANPLLVYPQLGEQFEGLGANAPLVIAPAMSVETFCFTAGSIVLL